MKQVNFIFIFCLLPSVLFAGNFKVECPLSAPTMHSLVKDSPYFVDDIHCVKNGQTYKWFISNKRILTVPAPFHSNKAREVKQLPAESPKNLTQKTPAIRKPKAEMIKRSIASRPQKKTRPPISYDKWKIGANYGVKYLSYEQSKGLGKAEVAVTTPEYYKIYSQYRYEDFEFQFDFERYNLRYKSGLNSGKEDLNELIFKSSYKNFVLGMAMIDTFIFKKEAGVISISKLSHTHAVTGYKMAWQLPVEKETHFEFNPTLYYPVAVSSENTDVKASKPSGHMVDFEAKLSRTIKKTDTYRVRAVWPVSIRHQSFSHDIEWGHSNGPSKTNMWSIGTQLGVEINF